MDLVDSGMFIQMTELILSTYLSWNHLQALGAKLLPQFSKDLAHNMIFLGRFLSISPVIQLNLGVFWQFTIL